MSEGHALGNADDSDAATDRTAPAMPRFAQNTVGRDFAVGDIHGCFTELQRGLEAIGFDPSTDRLFSVGDLVDRGPESHLALQWLHKPWFHAICGNHDFMAWRHAIGPSNWVTTLNTYLAQRSASRPSLAAVAPVAKSGRI